MQLHESLRRNQLVAINSGDVGDDIHVPDCYDFVVLKRFELRTLGNVVDEYDRTGRILAADRLR